MKFSESLFWIHILVFVVWIGLFFVPLSVWPSRTIFHFWYIITMVTSELITGTLMASKMHKFRIICPLTLWMQYLRGYSPNDPKNYDHSFVREFAERFKIRLPYGFVGALIFITLFIVIIQYILYIA